MRLWRRQVAHAIASLLASSVRSMLALLGIVIGSTAVIAMINIGYNAKQAMLREFGGMDARSTMIDYQGGAQIGVASLLSLRDWLRDRNPDIEAVAVTAVSSGTLSRQGESVEATVLGTTENFSTMVSPKLDDGRFISDWDGGEAYAVMGWDLFRDFKVQGVHLQVGDTVVFNGVPITVVGILNHHHHSLLSPIEVNTSLITPLHSMQRLNVDTARWRMLALRPEGTDYREMQRRLVEDVRRFLPYTDVRVTSPERWIESIEQQSRILTLTLGAIGGVSLLVGGLGVMNIMLVSVAERRQEIGLRLAIGARTIDIKRQFLIEALILCFLGGCIGLAAGVAIAFGFARYSNVDFVLSMTSVVLGLGVSTLVGLFSGYYPAVAAAKLDPVDALNGDG